MKILAIEFSSEQRSVAVVEKNADGSIALCGLSEEKGGRNTRAIGLVESVLHKASLEREQIDCIAVGLGPGSYTGIRAAIALAQGWQLARETKLIGTSSVECLAFQAQREKITGRVNFVIDAQRNEFYLAAYELDASCFIEVEALHLVTNAEVESRVAQGEVVFGPNAFKTFPQAQTKFPSAGMLGTFACEKTNFVSGESLEPIYLREISFVKAPPLRILPL